MKSGRLLLGIGILLSLAEGSKGADAVFDPPSDTVFAGTVIVTEFSVKLDGLSDFDFAFVNIGSFDATNITLGGYNSDWTDAFPNTSESEDSEGIYPQELVLSANTGNPNTGVGMFGLTVGDLAIDTAGMLPGEYFVVVDFDQDGSSELADLGEETQHDPLYGTFKFTIVPEPASLGLVMLGAVMLFRRR